MEEHQQRRKDLSEIPTAAKSIVLAQRKEMLYIEQVKHNQQMEETTVQKKQNPLLEGAGVLPRLSIVIIIISLVFHLVYYKHFGLPIKYFMNFSELGIAISDDLVFIILTYVVLIVFTLLNVKLGKFFERPNTNIKSKETKKKLYSDPIFQRMWIATLLVIQLLFMFIIKDRSLVVFDLFISFIFGSSILNFLLKNDDYDRGGILGNRNYSFISVFVLALSMRLSHDINLVEGGKYKGTIITTSDTTYISNDSTYFIGKTEKYVFVYKVKDSGTLVIPTESVKQMFIKSK